MKPFLRKEMAIYGTAPARTGMSSGGKIRLAREPCKRYTATRGLSTSYSAERAQRKPTWSDDRVG